MLPDTARRGLNAAMASASSSDPMSPACQISSTSLRNSRSVPSKVPCVSDMMPIFFIYLYLSRQSARMRSAIFASVALPVLGS